MSNYRIKTVEIQNIRSIRECKLNLEDKEGIIRIGGRNGSGKSTAFHIGLSALLALTPAKPLLKKNERMGYYRVSNGYGTFSFMVHQTEGVFYSYQLVNGEKGRSKDTVNHNPCIPIIRAYMGFNIDEEFNQALNLNSGSELKFVVTNGRSNLGFVKDLIFSEEIERIQRVAGEDIKEGKESLNRLRDKILYLNGEYNQIKTVNQGELETLEERLRITEQNLKVTNTLQIGIMNTIQLLRDKEQIQLRLLKNKIELIQNLSKESKKRNWELDGIKVDKLRINQIRDRKKQMVSKQNKVLQSIVEQTTPANLKANKRILIEIQTDELELTKQSLIPTAIKEVKMDMLSKQKDLIHKLKEGVVYQSITIKMDKIKYIKSMHYKVEQTRGFFTKFSMDIVGYTRLFLNEFSTSIKNLNETKRNIEVVKQDINKTKQELDREIYKEGRCVLCYSPKSNQYKMEEGVNIK